MANILIDGYNLIGMVKDHMEQERIELIKKLNEFSNHKGHKITVVFDGWKNGLPVETRTRFGNVTVIFSKLNEKADVVIKNILRRRQKSWIVVSSDREIINAAMRHNSVAITSDEFNYKLYT
ncbi:MAG: hypothetical protein D6828_02350, partial [Nitrospirae bacterium]